MRNGKGPAVYFPVMHIIIGIPPHIITHGMPELIIRIIVSQRSRSISICAGSIGMIRQVMPSLLISQTILQVIIGIAGIMPIIGFIMGIGMGIIIGIMPPIIG
jgi:hypothetical protein